MGAPHRFELAPELADRLVAVVGAEHALRTDPERDEYRDPFWHRDDRSYDSSLVLFPADLEQVRAIVRLANEHGVPLWTSSQGRNNGYGGPSPRVAGSVLLSLRRMNRVRAIDAANLSMTVEAGARNTRLERRSF